jgi:hypothetical protein
MRRTVPLHWHSARWRVQAPGPHGLLSLGVLTLLLVVPAERFGAAFAWTSQAHLIVNLGVALAAVMFGRDAGLADEAERWLVMQGQAPADWALARWAANLLPLATLAAIWALAVGIVTAALRGDSIAWVGVVALSAHLTATAVVLTLVLLLLGASGARQTAEGMLLILVVTLALPLVGERLPTVVMNGLRVLLPPLEAIAGARDAAVAYEWRRLWQALLHLMTWGTVVLGTALVLTNRRVPERPARARRGQSPESGTRRPPSPPARPPSGNRASPKTTAIGCPDAVVSTRTQA